jgi:hypothetical protein
MLPLTQSQKEQFEAAATRAANLTVIAIEEKTTGAAYIVISPTSTHIVYISKDTQTRTAMFHCDCRAHENKRICRCAAAALRVYKKYLLDLQEAATEILKASSTMLEGVDNLDVDNLEAEAE